MIRAAAAYEHLSRKQSTCRVDGPPDFHPTREYGQHDAAGRYSPSPIVEVVSKVRDGRPDPAHICTSHVERQNLTMRMAIRRFTRLTNAFSKKLDNLKAACALHFAYYNFCRIHQTLRVTPAMESGITDHVWTIAELLHS